MARTGPGSGPVAAFRRKLLKRLGRAAMQYARPKIPSRTLRKAMRVYLHKNRFAHVTIPHYWAVYVHDGRGAFGPKRARWLVWFTNPKDDPRTGFGTHHPVRAKDIRRLTKAQFEHGLRENQRRRLLGIKQPFMVVTKVHHGNWGTYFFDNRRGMAGFQPLKAAPIVREEFSKFVLSQIINDEDKVVARI